MGLPLDHLSASSLALFLRCPRQWQQNYLVGERSPSNSSLVIGSATHLGLSRALKGESIGNPFAEAVAEHSKNGPIVWKDRETASEKWVNKHIDNYMRVIGSNLNVVETEREIMVDIDGCDLPILGYVDVVTDRGIIDLKTTGYFRRQPELNPEWKLQMRIYQLDDPKPGEFHVLTRSTTNPVVVPSSSSDPLYVRIQERDKTVSFLQKISKTMAFYFEEFGDKVEWPGNVVHPWAAKYCPLGENCCQRS